MVNASKDKKGICLIQVEINKYMVNTSKDK